MVIKMLNRQAYIKPCISKAGSGFTGCGIFRMWCIYWLGYKGFWQIARKLVNRAIWLKQR